MKKIFIALLVIAIALFIVVTYAKSQSNAIIELNSDYTWNWVGGSPTPAVITNTPGPSQTPWIVTATLDMILTDTPTPEIFTPTPTPTEEPINKCWGVVTAMSLHVRDKPYGNHLGYVYLGDHLTFEAKWLDDYGSWWYAIWWSDLPVPGYVHSAYIQLGDTADCSQLPNVTPSAEHNVSLLWHTVPGFNWNNAAASYGILEAKNIDFGIKPYTDMDKCIFTLEAGGTCIYRHGAPDCPLNIGEGSATESALNFYITTAQKPRFA